MSTVSTAAKNWMVKSIIYREVIFFGKVNVDNEEELAALFKVTSIPLVVKIKDKKVVDSFVGTKGRSFLEEFFGK